MNIQIFNNILLNFENACLSSATDTALKSPQKENSLHTYACEAGVTTTPQVEL